MVSSISTIKQMSHKYPIFEGWLFFCLLFVVIKPENPYFASHPRLEVRSLGVHSGRVALPAVLPKVHHHPETLYVPTEVNTLQVDGVKF